MGRAGMCAAGALLSMAQMSDGEDEHCLRTEHTLTY
jgi:hypothetical protein